MSAKRKDSKAVVKEARRGKGDKVNVPDTADQRAKKHAAMVADHLPPLPLVLAILLCSGFMFMLGMRDMMSTGKIILGESDAAYLVREVVNFREPHTFCYPMLTVFSFHCH
jgi:hypothetical protein